MAEDTQKGPDTEQVLDLTALAAPRQTVRTSAGDFKLQRLSDLGAVDRARVNASMVAAQQVVQQLQAVQNNADVAEVQRLAAAVEDHENDILLIALQGCAREQLAVLPAPERAGVIAAFFGADAEGTRQAATAITQALAAMGKPAPSTGAKPSRGSKRSTGRPTPRTGSASTR